VAKYEKNRTCRSSLILILAIVQLQFTDSAIANPSIPSEIPVIVTVPEMRINATITIINGEGYAKVDSAYQTTTVYKFGDAYNDGHIKIAYDRIDAYYPIPINSRNITVQMDGQEINWTYRSKSFSHLFGVNLPNLNYSISPVPQKFLLTTHYEYPIQTTNTYAYLGTYAYLIPLESRYGLDAISGNYPGYSWVGWSNNSIAYFNIKLNSAFTNIHAYSINNIGTLKQLNFQAAADNTVDIQMPMTGIAPFGLVLTFDKIPESTQGFPIFLTIIAIVVPLFAVTIGLLYYRKRAKK
jgi:hypothetical protein